MGSCKDGGIVGGIAPLKKSAAFNGLFTFLELQCRICCKRCTISLKDWRFSDSDGDKRLYHNQEAKSAGCSLRWEKADRVCSY